MFSRPASASAHEPAEAERGIKGAEPEPEADREESELSRAATGPGRERSATR